jgi:predicted dehydrogenase
MGPGHRQFRLHLQHMIPTCDHSRRRFLGAVTGTAAAGLTGSWHRPVAGRDKSRWKAERPGIGAIGLRYQGSVIAHEASGHGDIVAICDVDQHVRDPVKALLGGKPRDFVDYRDLLACDDVDIVTIGTPDHWHTKMVVDACRAGKDVYCEKPLTLTIDEGRILGQVVRETGRVVQVGSWQRSDHRFRQAVEMVRQGRLGKLQQVDVVLGKNQTGGPFRPVPVPRHFHWELWQGQTPDVPYMAERTHYTFRWWYEYSGGQMTDWGAHHLDIAQWAIGSLPIRIEGQARFPEVPGGYNVASDFQARYRYANGVELTVRDTGRNGIMFTGTRGRIFVNRGALQGKPVEDLERDPLPREAWTAYAYDNLQRPPRAGKLQAIGSHMGNFFDCVQSRDVPVSDVESQHRSVSTCHLGNIAMRLGRPLQWDSEAERFVNDQEADTWLAREQRIGYEIK